MNAPLEIHSDPALLYLYYRVEESLGIKATGESLLKLNKFLEAYSGSTFIKNPEAFENFLGSTEHIFEVSSYLTINETYFFREGVHFEVLSRLLPQLILLNRPIQILSAATSIGCEAYSLAMLLNYHIKNGKPFNYEIDAFDINIESINTAKNGRYTSNAFRTDGAAWRHVLDSYLVCEGGDYVVSKDIRNKVHFFTHNIMDALDKQYDVIFFRNALIYFSPQSRPDVLNNLSKSLSNNGYLFLGISETSSGIHPLLANRCMADAFFFQKTSDSFSPPQTDTSSAYNTLCGKPPENNWEERRLREDRRSGDRRVSVDRRIGDRRVSTDRRSEDRRASPDRRAEERPSVKPQQEFAVDFMEMTSILQNKEGEPNAKKTFETLSGCDSAASASLPSAELAASVVYFLSVQNFNSADLVLSYLEKCCIGALVLFLRGEYHLLKDNVKEAESYFERAAGKDRSFWPAFYRLASLAAGGNSVRYIYKIKKACESLELGKDFHYECLMGGFSPDYFQRILEKKLI